MHNCHWRLYGTGISLALLIFLAGCSNGNNSGIAARNSPKALPQGKEKPGSMADSASSDAQADVQATAKPEDIDAVKKRLAAMGPAAQSAFQNGILTQLAIQDGSVLSADDFPLFGRLTDLKKLSIFNCRTLNNELASHLSGLQQLTTLKLTNSLINDAAVEMIVKSFPGLTELDLSSNANMSSDALKLISELTQLQSLTLIQDRFNDISTRRLSKLKNLRALDLRGNMEAGDMTLDIVAGLPRLTALKHRSTAVSDRGLEHLSRSANLEKLLIQDFAITSQSGLHLAKLEKLKELEVFRCQGFGTDGVLELTGLNLQRLTLRDLPNVDDTALEIFVDLPQLRRLFLLELDALTDDGLKHLSELQALEQLEIGSVPRMTDATLDVIFALPNLKDLSIRTTGVTDAAIEKLLAMPKLESLTFKENGSVTPQGLKRLTTKKWTKLDIGSSDASSTDTH